MKPPSLKVHIKSEVASKGFGATSLYFLQIYLWVISFSLEGGAHVLVEQLFCNEQAAHLPFFCFLMLLYKVIPA